VASREPASPELRAGSGKSAHQRHDREVAGLDHHAELYSKAIERTLSLRKKALLQRRQANLEDDGIHGLSDMTDVATTARTRRSAISLAEQATAAPAGLTAPPDPEST
jgi:hypothetical protein